jgi:Transposase DDE domain
MLLVAQLTPAQRLAAGLHPPPSVSKPFAAVQAAWRFYANENVTLDQLAGPMVQCAKDQIDVACDEYGLVVMDWCQVHLNGHRSLDDRVELAHRNDLGYEMLSGLLISDRDGSPIAPLGLDVRARQGIFSTRGKSILPPVSQLDGLDPLMQQAQSQGLGKGLVFIIDAEADSVAHYRQWEKQDQQFVVRADADRKVLWENQEISLGKVADELHRQDKLQAGSHVDYKGKTARAFAGETTVVLHRPARPHRVESDGKKRHRNVPGPAIALRLIISEVRDSNGKVLTRWLLLSNLSASVDATRITQWYYWRWKIESYHKLLKQAGHFLEQWQQESAAALTKRLLIASMACVIVWHLARDNTPAAGQLREILVQLSGRQIKRGKNRPNFTEPALLAGLGILLPMLALLQQYSPEQLTDIVKAALPKIIWESDTG